MGTGSSRVFGGHHIPSSVENGILFDSAEIGGVAGMNLSCRILVRNLERSLILNHNTS